MDDLVVVILTLIIAGAGILGQFKKKKDLPVASGEPKSPENIWDLFREEAFQPVIRTEPEYDNFEKEEAEPYINEQSYNFDAEKEGGTLISNELKIQHVVQKPIAKKKERFPLRKAVIYSEILNRKYT